MPTSNEDIIDYLVKFDRRLSRLERSVMAYTEAPSAAIVADYEVTGLTISSQEVLVHGTVPLVWLNLNWTEPSVPDTDPITHYEMAYSTDAGSSWSQIQFATAPPVKFGSFPVGQAVSIRVRARSSKNITGDWAIVSTTTTTDTDAPEQPSTPTIVNYLGQLVIRWDGLDYNSQAMGDDFSHCEVHYSTVESDFTVSDATMIGAIISQGGEFVHSDLTYGTTYYYKLRAVDYSQNKSSSSSPASGVPTQIVDTDLVDAAVTAAKLATDSVTTAALADGSVSASKVSFTAGDIGGVDQSTLDDIPTVTQGTSTPASPKTGDIWFDENNGNQLRRYNGSSWVVETYDTEALAAEAVTAAKIAAGTITAAKISTGAIGADQLAANAITVGSAVIADGAITEAKIGDAAVVTAKIGDAQITNAKIGDVSANKITTGVLQAGAKIIAGVSGGVRAELTSSGLYAYQSGSVPTVSLGSSTDEFLKLVNSQGATVASISSNGLAAFSNITTPGQLDAVSIILDGANMLDLLAEASRGVVFYGVDNYNSKFGSSSLSLPADSTTEVWEIAFSCVEDRWYTYYQEGSFFPASDVTLEYRYTLDGTKPTSSSTLLVCPQPNGEEGINGPNFPGVANAEQSVQGYFQGPGTGFLRMALFAINTNLSTVRTLYRYDKRPVVIRDEGTTTPAQSLPIPGTSYSSWIEQDPLEYDATWSGTFDNGHPSSWTDDGDYWTYSGNINESQLDDALRTFTDSYWNDTQDYVSSLGDSIELKEVYVDRIAWDGGVPGYDYEMRMSQTGGWFGLFGFDPDNIQDLLDDPNSRITKIEIYMYVEDFLDPGSYEVEQHYLSDEPSSRPSTFQTNWFGSNFSHYYSDGQGQWWQVSYELSGDTDAMEMVAWRVNLANEFETNDTQAYFSRRATIHGASDTNPPRMRIHWERLTNPYTLEYTSGRGVAYDATVTTS